MKKYLLIAFIGIITLLSSCGDINNDATQIGENTFIHKSKDYSIINNQITELGNFKSDTIAKSTVLSLELIGYGKYSLSHIKKEASSNLGAVYRGDILYFKMDINGLNDLREKYNRGELSLNFLDVYGFEIHKTPIKIGELIRIADSNDETLNFEYNGKTQMSSEIHKAIFTYSVSSSLR